MKSSVQYKGYLPLKIKLGNRVKTVQGLLDSGNSLKADFAIRADAHRKLGVGFKKRRNIALGTAKPKSSLLCIGVSNPFEIYVPGAGSYVVTPVVLESLTDELNIGNSFLHRLSRDNEVSIKYKDGDIQLAVNSLTVPLLQQLQAAAAAAPPAKSGSVGPAGRASQPGPATPSTAQTDTAPPDPRNLAVISTRNDIIDPYSYKWVRVHCPVVETGTILEAENDCYSYGGVELLQAVYDPTTQSTESCDGRILTVCLINPSCEAKQICKNEKLGSFYEVHVVEREKEVQPQPAGPGPAGGDGVQRLRPIRKPGQPAPSDDSYDF